MAEEPGKTPQTPQEPKAGATFTQEDIDRVAAKVRAEERAKYGDYNDTKAELARLKEEEEARAEAEKTERQKEIDAARKEERKATEKEWQAKLAARDREVAICDALRDAGADPDAGVLLRGQYEPESVEDIPAKVELLLKDKPHLVILKPGSVPAQGAAGSPSSTGKPGVLTRARLEELRATGTWKDSEERKLYMAGKLALVD